MTPNDVFIHLQQIKNLKQLYQLRADSTQSYVFHSENRVAIGNSLWEKEQQEGADYRFYIETIENRIRWLEKDGHHLDQIPDKPETKEFEPTKQ